MKSIIQRHSIQTTRDTELINLTALFREAVANSGVQSGLALIMTMHTTTAITVNEGLPDLEDDLVTLLKHLATEGLPYRHARFLHSDGQMAVNAPSHLRGALLGMQALFPVEGGQPLMGQRQSIYLVELDGPLQREVIVQILGE